MFKKLRSCRELQLLTYDENSDVQSLEVVKIPDTCLIMIEGVFLQRTEWRRFYDFMIYLDCPRDKRYNRESDATQSNVEKFKNRYWKAEEYYLKTETPQKRADLVFQN